MSGPDLFETCDGADLGNVVDCPACGLPVAASFLRPIPPDGSDGPDPADVCADCLGAIDLNFAEPDGAQASAISELGARAAIRRRKRAAVLARP
jgi:hypothetical protein